MLCICKNRSVIFQSPRSFLLIISFGYGGCYQPSLPVVLTACSDSGYKSDFIKYSMEELYTIVNEVKDCSLPEVDNATLELGIVGRKVGDVVIGRLSKRPMWNWSRRDAPCRSTKLFEMPLLAHGLLIVLIIRIWYWDRWMRRRQQYYASEENNIRNVVLCVFVNHSFFIRLD